MSFDMGSIMKMLGDPKVQQLIKGVFSQIGGGKNVDMNGLMQQLQGGGLGDQAKSWAGTGANQPVTGAQIEQALGPEVIKQAADQAGIPVKEAADDLAQVLPQMVNSATPKGEIPQKPMNLDDILGQLFPNQGKQQG